MVGPGHIMERRLNQDAWISFRTKDGIGIAVSDGLGSKSLSNFGSRAACRAVRLAAKNTENERRVLSTEHVASQIKSFWLDALGPIDPNEAGATCLFAYTNSGDFVVGALGDGCIAVISRDNSIKVLEVDKSRDFLNSTNALSPKTQVTNWRLAKYPARDVEAVIIMSDGIADDLVDVPGFAREVCLKVQCLPDFVVTRHLRTMLGSWNVPKHSDDKSIACLIRRRHVEL